MTLMSGFVNKFSVLHFHFQPKVRGVFVFKVPTINCMCIVFESASKK